MTIREVIDVVCEGQPLTDELVQQALFVIVGGMRTELQKEASTFDGDCAGCVGWIEKYGPATVKNFAEWMEANPEILAREIPDEALVAWVSAPDVD